MTLEVVLLSLLYVVLVVYVALLIPPYYTEIHEIPSCNYSTRQVLGKHNQRLSCVNC